jgi:pimeloyl-ACP methyl ester carboxylesterase
VGSLRRLGAIGLATTLVWACGSTAPSSSSPTHPAQTAPPSAASVVAYRPHFDATPCPEDVTQTVVLQISCGYLTVLEDRAKPDGRTIQLFVIRVEPPGGTTTSDPVIAIGNLGRQNDYGGLAAIGQRTHRIAYLVDLRGIGHSKPSLDCPEVASVALAGLRLRDPARRAKLLDAVRACHDRLVGQGIDLAAYDLQANAADIEDLRTTLGISSWNLGAYGDGTRLAFEVERRFPAGLRSVFIDSPTLPTPDLLTIGPTALDLAISRLVATCALQPACVRGFPDLDASIRDAIVRLDAKPVSIDVTTTVAAIQAGHPIHVIIDGAALVRFIRASLSADGGQGAGDITHTVRAVLDGKLTADDQVAVSLASDAGDCLGLLPLCEGMNFGVLYSIVCQDMAPQIDPSRLQTSIAGRPAYADVFDPSPLLAACDVWPPGHPGTDSAGSVTGGVPTLVFHGAFDPFSAPPSDLGRAVNGIDNVFVLEVPNQSYNAIGFNDCGVAIRNAWIDAPTAPPVDTSCLEQIPPIQLGP